MILAIKAWIAGNKLIFYVGLLIAVLALATGIYYKGFFDGVETQSATQAKAERAAIDSQRGIEQNIMTLPKNEVQKRLEAKWCRDCS